MKTFLTLYFLQIALCLNFLDNFQLDGRTDSGAIRLPLQDISIKIDINNNLAFYTMSQTYINSDKMLLETIYHFPFNSECVIDSFKAIIGNKTLIGIVKEKKAAKEEYEKEKAAGNTVIYSDIEDGPSDIMNLQIGNIYPEEKIVVQITFIEKIKIKLNKFWEFRLFNTLTERYGQKIDIPFVQVTDDSRSNIYTWDIFVHIKMPRELQYLSSPSHENDINIEINDNNCEAIIEFKPEIRQFPNHDFIIQFNTKELHKPIVRTALYEDEIIGQFSFIPDMLPNAFNQTNQKEQQQQQEEDLEKIYQENGQGEFIFVIDRSGSMSGSRIENLKKALIEFMKVLPTNSYFNIISYGSTFDSMFSKSQKYSKSIEKKVIAEIKQISANYGGTEIYEPLKFALAQKKINAYPRFVFLLTDGDIWNTNDLLKMAQSNLKSSRIYTIGIGNGVSTHLIQELAKIGNGKSLFVHEKDNLKELAANMVRSAVSPFLYNFQLIVEDDYIDDIQQIVPNPENVPFVLKDEEVTFYLKFTQGERKIPVKLQFLSSVDHSIVQYAFVFDLKQPENSSVLHKMMYNIIIKQLLSKNQKDSTQAALKYALKYQILCSETAIILVDYKQLELYSKDSFDSETVNIPNVISDDYNQPKYGFGFGFVKKLSWISFICLIIILLLF